MITTPNSAGRAFRVLARWAGASLLALLATLVGLFVLGVLWPEPKLVAVRTRGPIAITGVTVVDVVQGRLRPGQTVVIEEGIITRVEPAAAIPPGARQIDGQGRFLIPAFWDMHAHVYAVSPLLDLPLYLAFGVTNVRDMQGCPTPGDPFIACAGEKRAWTAQAEAGALVAPRIAGTTSFMANGPRMLARLGGVPTFFGTANAGEARAFVRHFAGEADAIKVYDHLPRDAYFALVAEARRLGLDVVGHRPHAVSAIEAAAHQKSIEHARFLLHESFSGSEELRSRANSPAWKEDRRRMLDDHDPDRAEAIFAAMRRHGTWYVPTHLTRWVDAYADHPSVRKDPLLRFLHPLMQWQWLEDVDATLARDPSPEARQTYRDFYTKGLALTGAAHRAGVKILAGTDYIVPGADLHRELEHLVAAGLTPAEALRAATISAAEYFGLTAQFGSVAPGKTADLVLLEADPLADIRNTQRIAGVFFAGSHYDRARLDQILAHVEGRAGSWTVACKILWRFLKNPVNY